MYVFTAVLLATASGCVHYHPAPTDTTNVSHDNLHRLVGQTITLRGNFSLRGKFGPYILVNSGPVYLQPTGSFTWGRSWADMEGRMVKVTGVLHFSPLDAQRSGGHTVAGSMPNRSWSTSSTTSPQERGSGKTRNPLSRTDLLVNSSCRAAPLQGILMITVFGSIEAVLENQLSTTTTTQRATRRCYSP